MPEPEILAVPPREAVAHFRAKGYHVGYSWLDTAAGEHTRSFTVAKAMRLDVLEAIRGEVDRAIADGITFEDFEKALEPRLREMGWWGRGQMVDPLTGELRNVQLGSRHRLRTIFDTNLRMSYAKGRWEMIERDAAAAPYLMYDAVNDALTRPEHLAWDGTVLRWDDPWWRSHYPPNGWFCRCRVIQMSEEDLEEFGIEPSGGPPAESLRTRPWTNKRTGETHQVPIGIDPGFQDNVGLVGGGRDTADRLIGKMDAASPDMARAVVGSPWRTALFHRHLAGRDEGDWPVAAAPAAVLAAAGGQSQTVRLSGASAAKQAERHGDLSPEDYARVQAIIDQGEFFEAGGHHVMGFLEMDGRPWRAVVKATRDGAETYVVSFHKAQPYDLEAARRHLPTISR